MAQHTMTTPRDINWHKCNAQVFWGEIAPCDHLVQIYENDDVIMDALEGFVSSGFNAGDSVIIIATDVHLAALEQRLKAAGFNLNALRLYDQFIALDAAECLSKFMVEGWPVDHLFLRFVTDLVTRARGKNERKVRAYGEMVAILWEKGHNGATVQLEYLWNKFCETETFCLFCAYPKSGFTQDLGSSVNHICSAHTKLIAGDVQSTTEIFYKSA
jgi:hypothetical protein